MRDGRVEDVKGKDSGVIYRLSISYFVSNFLGVNP
jgi:hypothetical protein